MGIEVVEAFGDRRAYCFTDPDVFMSCDNPDCDTPWVTHAGLVAWAIERCDPNASRFTDCLLVACSPGCLRGAQAAVAHRRLRWSHPVPVASWLAALTESLERDPTTTPIGEFAGAA